MNLAWLAMKRAELLKAHAIHGDDVKNWDLWNFMEIIDEQTREIKRLKETTKKEKLNER